MVAIRAVRADDLGALYRVALATGNGGADAAALYRDPKLLGHIYAAPYVVLCPKTVFVAQDADGVGGYIVGAADTPAFEAQLEAEWWPSLRAAYPAPPDPPPVDTARGVAEGKQLAAGRRPRRVPAARQPDERSSVRAADMAPDQRRIHQIHRPHRTPGEITSLYPSHLHINLLPRLRGRGVGQALMDRWLAAVRERGSTGAHLAVGIANARAIRFYSAYGFHRLASPLHPAAGATWLGITLRNDT